LSGSESMRRALSFLLALLLIAACSCCAAWAQATAQITGTVKDQSGAVLPGTEVTATQTETGIARTAVTNETGSYVLSNLAIGPYRIEAGLPGFRTFVQTGVVLQVNASPVINPVLQVGQVNEEVEVQANATLVETRTVGVGQVVENAMILELPLNGRQVGDLIGLAGGTAPATVPNGRDSLATPGFSVAGGLNTGINYTLDGGNHNNPGGNGSMVLPFPDALQEFKVETSATSAQNGLTSAGNVSLVTKSGTNEVHGDAFEFVRNGSFNARNSFALRRDTLKRNQFGGTVGGPIRHNKLFFFGGYQGTTLRTAPSDNLAFVPTAAMLAGDFTDFASAACNAGRAITLRAPFVNNRVNPALFSRPALNLTAKLPKTADPCGKIVYATPDKTDDHQFVGKIDYQRNANHSIFARYVAENLDQPAAYDLAHNPLNLGTGADTLAQLFTIGDTYLFGPNVVNSFRLTTNRVAGGKFEPKDMPSSGLGPNAIGVRAYAYAPDTAQYTINGGFSVASQGGPTKTAVFGGNDDLSIVRGNHQVAVGINLSLAWLNTYSHQYSLPFNFNGQRTGLGMGDFLLGYVATLTNGPASPKSKRAERMGIYYNDTWKLNPKFAVNYGVRWEPYFAVLDREGGPIHFDHDAFAKGVRSQQFDTTPPGVSFPGDPGFPGREGQYSQWLNFSPRVGLAWDLHGDGRTSLRASGGTFYDYPPMQYQNLASAPPYFPRFSITDVDFENPWANYPGGDPFPLPYGNKVGRNAPWPAASLVNVVDYDTPNMQVAQWNLSLQREVSAGWLVSASYLGTHTTHLWSTQQYNPSVFLGLGPCTLNGVQYSTCSTTTNQEQRRRLILENPQYGQFYGFMPKIDTGGTASYNGLVVSAQRRATSGVTVNANYTWSHCITDPGGSDLVVGTSNNNGYTNPDNRHASRGNCTTGSSDRRHVLNLSAVAATPQFSNATLRMLGSGWRFSPIFRVLSGSYMTITTNQDRALNTTPGQRVNQILSSPYGDRSVSKYLNPAAFELPAMGTLGNMGQDSVAGPATWQFDASLSRTFQLREKQKIEFRAEAFNVTNSFRMNNPTVNFNSNTFGQVTTSKDPRIMQFALKYVF
jgi:Carboxypeptidase regulatory-like domain